MKSFFTILPSFVALVSALPVTSQPDQLSKRNSSFTPPDIKVQTISAAASSSWWYPNMDHSSGAVRGYAPFLPNNDYNYPVYVAVQPGDDLNAAIRNNGPNGDRDGNGNEKWGFNEPRVVYLAPGTYTLSQTLDIYTDTVILGDAANPPTIKAASSFNGQNMILGGQDGTGNGGELHFSVQIKNVILDTTANGASDFAALSWRVAQNCALENVKIVMPSNTHTGITMGQGSTISVADTRIEKGAVGLHYDGSQQAQIKNFYFYENTVALQIDGGNAITVFACTFDTVGRSIVYNTGSSFTAVIDATSTNSGDFFTVPSGVYPNFMIENLNKDTTDSDVVVVGGKTLIGGGGHVATYVYGNTYGANPIYQTSPNQVSNTRPSALAPNGRYPVGVAPSYSDVTTDGVINVKDSSTNGGQTVHGDGSSDETDALNAILATAAQQNKIAYFPFGVYRVTDTLFVPVGTRIVGEGWSTISGFGENFSDESNPRPIVKIGNPDDVGSAVIQDMRFTVGEQLAGAIIVQVNMAGNSPTDVAIYNSLITVGGTRDTTINCDSESNCRAAFVGLHLTSSSSAYIENMWSWVADHASDSSSGGTRSAAKGGVLVEATKGTWLVGLGSEHWWLYSLNYANAENVFVSFFQAETNYHQSGNNDPSSATPPYPFTPVQGVDPDFSWCSGGSGSCYQGPAEYINGGSNIYHYSAGAYNFNNAEQATMNVINAFPDNLQLYGITTHAAHEAIRLPDGTRFGDDDHSDGFGGAWGALVAAYLDHASTTPA